MHGTAAKTALADVIVTDELTVRAPGRPDPTSEKSAFRSIAASMVDSPERVLSQLVDLAIRLTGGGAGGLSLYEPKPVPGVFRWHHLQGPLKCFDGATTPRNFSPCGVTLDRRAPVLCANPERHYSWLVEAGIVLPEVLLVPLFIGNDDPFGTLWIVGDRRGHFNQSHVRTLADLSSFVSVALRMDDVTRGRAIASASPHELRTGFAPEVLPAEALVRKLSTFEVLSDSDAKALHAAVVSQTHAARGASISSTPERRLVVRSGIVGECRHFDDGRRQVVRLYLPGDLVPQSETASLGLEAMSACEIVELSNAAFTAARRDRPAIARTLDCARVLGDAMFFRWVATLGGRSAEVRIAHLVHELYLRFTDVGLAGDTRFELPLTQQDLAEIAGLSLVHTNKSLRRLVTEGILSVRLGVVEIRDRDALLRRSELSPKEIWPSSRDRAVAGHAARISKRDVSPTVLEIAARSVSA